MSNIVRNIVLATALVSATGVSFAARQGNESVMRNPLSISMLADSSSAQAFMGTVEFKITNNSSSVLKVPYWQLPSASEEGKLFQVFHNGKAATYLGPMIKRPAPTEADMVTFQPYETKLISVDLSKSYDLSKGGDYTVSFLSYLHGARTTTGHRLTASNGRMASLQSVPLKLWVDGSNRLNPLKPGADSNARGGTTTTVRRRDLRRLQFHADHQRSCRCGAGPRLFRGWQRLPGRATSRARATQLGLAPIPQASYSTVNQHFVAIDAAIDQSGNQIKINCGCRKNYYAYVYPNSPYEIFVCNAFWSAPTAGTDSKGGTLIHETSHFTVVAGTDDWVYGQAGAKNLALTNPTNAIDNADSHEYFAENTPAQN